MMIPPLLRFSSSMRFTRMRSCNGLTFMVRSPLEALGRCPEVRSRLAIRICTPCRVSRRRRRLAQRKAGVRQRFGRSWDGTGRFGGLVTCCPRTASVPPAAGLSFPVPEDLRRLPATRLLAMGSSSAPGVLQFGHRSPRWPGMVQPTCHAERPERPLSGLVFGRSRPGPAQISEVQPPVAGVSLRLLEVRASNAAPRPDRRGRRGPAP
jgi:hypothetical protein